MKIGHIKASGINQRIPASKAMLSTFPSEAITLIEKNQNVALSTIQFFNLIFLGFLDKTNDIVITRIANISLNSFHQSGLAILTREILLAVNNVAISNIDANGIYKMRQI
jgi:hypothetical protein